MCVISSRKTDDKVAVPQWRVNGPGPLEASAVRSGSKPARPKLMPLRGERPHRAALAERLLRQTARRSSTGTTRRNRLCARLHRLRRHRPDRDIAVVPARTLSQPDPPRLRCAATRAFASSRSQAKGSVNDPAKLSSFDPVSRYPRPTGSITVSGQEREIVQSWLDLGGLLPRITSPRLD